MSPRTRGVASMPPGCDRVSGCAVRAGAACGAGATGAAGRHAVGQQERLAGNDARRREGRMGHGRVRRHRAGDRGAWAEFSPCGRWRYVLARRWAAGPGLLCVLLNPSRADAVRNDPTLLRCVARAQRLGFGGLRVVNLFAWRARDPAALGRAVDPVGPENDAALLRGARWADRILCGWGAGGRRSGRDAEVLRLLGRRRLWHLGLTAGGQPRHPLYVGYEVAPQEWR